MSTETGEVHLFHDTEDWLRRYDNGEFCFDSSEEAFGEAAKHFGEAAIPESWARRHWPVVDFLEEPLGQAVIVLRP